MIQKGNQRLWGIPPCCKINTTVWKMKWQLKLCMRHCSKAKSCSKTKSVPHPETRGTRRRGPSVTSWRQHLKGNQTVWPLHRFPPAPSVGGSDTGLPLSWIQRVRKIRGSATWLLGGKRQGAYTEGTRAVPCWVALASLPKKQADWATAPFTSFLASRLGWTDPAVKWKSASQIQNSPWKWHKLYNLKNLQMKKKYL